MNISGVKRCLLVLVFCGVVGDSGVLCWCWCSRCGGVGSAVCGCVGVSVCACSVC